MTDFEMTKLCADAMGFKVTRQFPSAVNPWVEIEVNGRLIGYKPLHEDAQAMVLVKKFRLEIDTHIVPDAGEWCVLCYKGGGLVEQVISSDLNRAIVECVSKMQSGKYDRP